MTPILPQSTDVVNLCLSCTLPACVYDSPRINPDLCPIEAAKLATVALRNRIDSAMAHCPCGYVGPRNKDFLTVDGYVTSRCRRCRAAIRRGGLHLRRFKIQAKPKAEYKPGPPGRRRIYDDQLFIKLHKQGLGVVAIARAIGCSRDTVRLRLAKLLQEATP